MRLQHSNHRSENTYLYYNFKKPFNCSHLLPQYLLLWTGSQAAVLAPKNIILVVQFSPKTASFLGEDAQLPDPTALYTV